MTKTFSKEIGVLARHADPKRMLFSRLMRVRQTILALCVITLSVISSASVNAQQTFSTGIRNDAAYSQSSTSEFQVDAPNIFGGRFRIETDGRSCFGCSTAPVGLLDLKGTGWVHFNNDVSGLVDLGGIIGIQPAPSSFHQGIAIGMNKSIGTSYIRYANDVTSGLWAGVAPRLQIGRSDQTQFTPELTLAGGKLGLNTDTPLSTLDVNGTSRFRENAIFGSTTNFAGNIFATVGNSMMQLTSNGLSLTDAGGENHVFIKPGKLGIGTSNPESALQVYGDAIFENASTFKGAVTFNSAPSFTGGFSSGAMTLQNNRVGIGQSQPHGVLDVAGSGWTYFTNDVINPNNGAVIIPEYKTGLALGYRHDSGASLIAYSTEGYTAGEAGSPDTPNVPQLQFGSSTRLQGGISVMGDFSPQMTLKDGKLGIGTVDPRSTLHVNGASTFENSSTFKGTSTFESNSIFNGASRFVNTSIFEDAVTFKKSTTFAQGITLNALQVNGTSAFTDLVTAATVNVSGAAEFGGATSFLSATNFHSDVTATSGNSTLQLSNGSLTFNTLIPNAGGSTFQVSNNMLTFSGAGGALGNAVFQVIPNHGLLVKDPQQVTTNFVSIRPGKLGINTESSTKNFHVNGTSEFRGSSEFYDGSTFNGTSVFAGAVTFTNAPVFNQGVSINQLGVNTATPRGLLHVGNGTVPAGGTGSANWSYFEGNAHFSSPSTAVKQGLAVSWNKSGGNGESIIAYNKGLGNSPRLDFSSWNPNTSAYATEMTLKNGNLGVGNLSPVERMDVQGVLRVTNKDVAASYTDNIRIFSDNTSARIESNGDENGLYLNSNGGNKIVLEDNVGIGTANLDAQYRLSVLGKIRSNEIVLESDWADFVFDDSYKLKTLYEVDEYIQKNGHLPDVPSAAEVKEKGLSVSEMQTVMMQKIEELTLYVIELQKQNDELKSQIKSQSK